MGSPFCAGETVDLLMLKLRQNKVKIDCAKDLMMQLQNLVNHISEDTNRIENQLRPHLQSMMSSSFVYPENLLLLPSDSNSGITESTYFSHIPPTVDTFMDYDSFLDFSNINHVFDTRNNLVFVNEQAWNQQGVAYPGMPESNRASLAFENVEGGNILPEKGKLHRSVVNAGSFPIWCQPPPQAPQQINFVPPLTIKDHDMADLGNGAGLQGDSFSDSMPNFAGLHSDPWIASQVTGSKRQRLY